MNKMPLVSVVVASYNHKSFIIDALDSVVKQTYPNLELIIVDDCSKDTSVSKIKEWIKKEENKKRFVRLIVETKEINSGAHNTLNKGADIAEGKFVNFLNSDDLFEPNRIERLVNELNQLNACWGFTGVNVIDNEGIEISSVGLPPEVGFVYEGIEHARKNYPTLSCGLLERNFVVSTGNIFVDVKLFQQEPMYSYRLHGTNSFKSLANVAAVEGAFVMQDYFRALDIDTPNALAPSPKNWPVLFDLWVDSLGLRHFF
ncbi:MAG: glycosyltransferase family 2 protein [Methylococcales bacterium]|nr:glycosyltransferase family 2 protein [Methylococcales bacterium]